MCGCDFVVVVVYFANETTIDFQHETNIHRNVILGNAKSRCQHSSVTSTGSDFFSCFNFIQRTR